MEIESEPAVRQFVFPPKRIAVPVDYSECSRVGLAAAEALARRWGSALDLVHVEEGPPPALSEGAGPESEPGIDAYEAAMRQRVERMAAGIPGASARVVRGLAREELPRLAAREAADLVVMGTHGRRGLERLVLGSVAEATARAAEVPVLAARLRPEPRWPSRILVPMKWTDYADTALLAALDWAKSLRLAVTLLHVGEEGECSACEIDALRGHVARLLGEGAPPADWMVGEGRPFEEILRGADRAGADLIVLSAHARGFLQRAFLATTAEKVLRRSRVPVLVVPAGPAPELSAARRRLWSEPLSA